jgi:HK97 family phage prohead protease
MKWKKKQFQHFITADIKAKGDDLFIEGYASTFGNADLENEIVDEKAFDGFLEEYMANPILLANHKNTVESAVGTVEIAQTDKHGLKIKAKLSKAKDEFTTMVRDKVREGTLKALSIGGLFYREGNMIMRVKLLEISIVPIPANPMALFSPTQKGLSLAKALSLSLDDELNGKAATEGNVPNDGGETDSETLTAEEEESTGVVFAKYSKEKVKEAAAILTELLEEMEKNPDQIENTEQSQESGESDDQKEIEDLKEQVEDLKKQLKDKEEEIKCLNNKLEVQRKLIF